MLCGFRSQQRTRLDAAAAAAAAVAAAVTDNGSYRSAYPSKSSLTAEFGREMAADLVARPLQAIFIWQCSIMLDPQAIAYGRTVQSRYLVIPPECCVKRNSNRRSTPYTLCPDKKWTPRTSVIASRNVSQFK